MSPALRLTALHSVARLRALGPLPWVLLVAWAAWSGAQEPAFLRRFRIDILHQGLWSAGFAVLLSLLCSCRSLKADGRSLLYSNWLLLLFVGAVVTLLAAAVDQVVLGVSSPSAALRIAICMLAAATPAATALSVIRTNGAAGFFVGIVASVMSVALAESYWTNGLTPANLGSVLLLSAAATLFVLSDAINCHQ